MKTIMLCIVSLALSSIISLAAPVSNDPDVVAITTAIPDGTEIRKTTWGYKVNTPSGTRNVYKTSLGYRITGNATSANIDLRKTSSGYRIENNELRGRALGSR